MFKRFPVFIAVAIAIWFSGVKPSQAGMFFNLIEVDPIIRTTGGPALDSGRRSFSTPWAIDFPRCLIT